MTIHEYHSPSDRAYARQLRHNAPEQFAAYRNLSDTAQTIDGEIPLKYRELIALAVGLTTQCAYCLETHTAKAKKEGATEKELAEVVFVTASLCAGAAVSHGMLAMKLFLHD